MDLRGRDLKLTAVAVLVVLTLTGFSTGRHRGGTGGGGGGCSSSGQDHDSSSSSTSGGGAWSGSDGHDDYDDHDDDDDHGGASGGSSGHGDPYDDSGSGGPDSTETLRDASVRPVECVTGEAPYSRVEVTNPNASTATFAVDVSFEDREGGLVKQETWYIEVAGGDRLTVDIESSNISRATEVAGCDVDEIAEPEEV